MLKQNIFTFNKSGHQYGQAYASTQVTYLKSISSYKPEEPQQKAPSQLLPSKTASKQMYFDLTRKNFTQHDKLLSQLYLNEKLLAVEDLESDFPDNIADVEAWMDHNNSEVGKQYQEYLSTRKNGAPRQLFKTKAHAYFFLQSVAPTKLVDGSWLYGLCDLWKDHRFSNLIKTYLEELGEGDDAKNHVVLYKKLLASHDCDQWQNLSDDYFTQGAIQLALGYNAKNYIPEIIGFNLGYEQLPLHLLVTAYELKELGIDPYYFTLHITVDNASTGHARKALQALYETMPALANTQEFFRRVSNGYKLNQLGLNTNKIIASFDLNKEFLSILKSKSFFGQSVHSDKCRFNGKTINDWLSDPAKIPDFVNSLIENGWIKRDQDPQLSRFWKLIEGDTAKMFGVFNGYEKQVIYDWIAGKEHEKFMQPKPKAKTNVTYLNSALRSLENAISINQDTNTVANVIDPDVAKLEKQLAAAGSIDEIMNLLVPLISPSLHHNPMGLLATQLYKSLLHKTPTVANNVASLS
ncbi:MAG TPA: iron-containing redox enzyme family protein [Methylotenera sp.]|nr:iron-containing redox enzyme family protein [Methylotenera sp.]